jgi:hypothetical protein
MFVQFLIVVVLALTVASASAGSVRVGETQNVEQHGTPLETQEVVELSNLLKKQAQRRIKLQRSKVTNGSGAQNDGNAVQQKTSLDASTPAYIIQKSRPNSDCSGDTAMTVLQKTGVCFQIDDNVYARCDAVDVGNGVIDISYTTFSTDTCTGTGSLEWTENHDKCEFDVNAYESSMGFRMQSSSHVTTTGGAFPVLPPGVVTTLHYGDTGTCATTPIMAFHQSFNACQMATDEETGRYLYYKMTECSTSGNNVKVLVYDDQNCLRPRSWGRIATDFDACETDDDGVYVKTTCSHPQ